MAMLSAMKTRALKRVTRRRTLTVVANERRGSRLLDTVVEGPDDR